jgi:hypothetical protein
VYKNTGREMKTYKVKDRKKGKTKKYKINKQM